MCSHSLRRALAGSALLATLALGLAAPALAHEQRTLGTYSVEVGLIAEPVYTGDRSGLELIVTKLDEAPAPGGASPDPAASPAPVAEEPSGTPVTGLESTIQAEVIFGDHKRSLPITAREGEPGVYESVFIPTAAGPYTFHLTGAIETMPIDESFTSSPDGFNEVEDVAAGQFPVALAPLTDIAANAQKGADAAGQVSLALGAGIVGIVIGVAGLGIGLASRRRPA